MNIAFALPPLLVDPGSSEGQRARECIRKCALEVGRAKMRPQGVVFGIDDAFHPRASKTANAIALRALLDCLINLDVIILRAYPNTPKLYESGVFYKLMPSEAPWDTTPIMFRRGFTDCKSLVAARIAELIIAGKVAMPVFRNIKDGWGTMFHILILHGNGQWECPSSILGMHAAQEVPYYSMA
ncbi:Uncharacterised protein [uncultured archaeon]|nr:Uncharacterised protein [uncultured archaeon]